MFNIPAGQRVIELGGGDNPCPGVECNVDLRPGPKVAFTHDFDEPFGDKLSADEWDGLIMRFALEHISWRRVPTFLKECFHILKPGGWAKFVVPNTEAQMKYILNKPEWDGDESCMLFGDQNHVGNHHTCAFSPLSAIRLLQEAGFEGIVISPVGELATDMCLEAAKPKGTPPQVPAPDSPTALLGGLEQQGGGSPPPPPPVRVLESENMVPLEPEKPPREVYNRGYWDSYQGGGFVWDFPHNYLVAQKVLDRKPESVLEVGCGRGYVLKRVQDQAGVRVQGVDVSASAWLTRVVDPVLQHNLLQTPWPVGKQEFDLVFSQGLLEHLPEGALPEFFYELARVAKRGLHGVTFAGEALNHDPTRRTLKDRGFWEKLLPEGHQLFSVAELQGGELPVEYLRGDGKTKLNLGCAWTCFHNGWLNLDTVDAVNFAQAFKYNFAGHDVTQGLPYGTGVVDLIFSSHMLEHLTAEAGLKLLRECRRVIRPEGAVRILVPDAGFLTKGYVDLKLGNFDEMNEGCAKSPTRAGKLWALLVEGHQTLYDWETLSGALREAGFVPTLSAFRENKKGHPAMAQVLRETVEMGYGGLSLVVEATPDLG